MLVRRTADWLKRITPAAHLVTGRIDSTADGAVIGAGAGVAYGIIVAVWGNVASTPSFSGFFGLAFVAAGCSLG